MHGVAVMEIGTSKISVIVGSLGINNTLNIIGSHDESYSGFYDGEFVEEEKLSQDICNALAKAEINSGEKIKKIYVGVPAEFSICKTKTFMQSFGDKIKIDQSHIINIYQEANELKENTDYILISCSPINFILDDGRQTLNPVLEKTSRLSGEISYVYAERQFISKINVALRKFGISTVEYLSSPLSECVYLLSAQKREQANIVVDCGYITTSVLVIKGDGLMHLSTFPVGGGQVVSDLSDCLRISYKEAEYLKKQIVLSVVPELGDGYEIKRNNQLVPISMKDANEVVSERLSQICTLINKSLSGLPKNDLSKMPIYLTGGGICFIKGAKDYLSKQLGVNVEILIPPHLEYTKPNYAESLGLLNTAIKQDKKQKTNKILKLIKKITNR